MKKSMKTVWILIGLLVVIFVIWMLQKNVPVPYSYETTTPTPSSAVKAGNKNVTGIGTVPATATVAYQEALTKYVGKLVQFDDQCHGTPGQMVIKKGAKIMLDNRSKNSITVGLDNQTISLAPYHYQIVTMTTSKTLPYNMGLDCKSSGGSNTNTTTVQIQASILQLLPQ